MRVSNDDDDDNSWYEYKDTAAMKNGRKYIFVMSSMIGQIRNAFLSDEIKIQLENCALLGHYAASSGNLLRTFQDNLSFQFSEAKNLKNNWIFCLCNVTLFNIIPVIVLGQTLIEIRYEFPPL